MFILLSLPAVTYMLISAFRPSKPSKAATTYAPRHDGTPYITEPPAL